MPFDMPVTETAIEGENWMWAVYPMPGDNSRSIRVNQLINYSQKPPVYDSPRIEISDFWIVSPAELRSFRTALDQAELKALDWAEHTGVSV